MNQTMITFYYNGKHQDMFLDSIAGIPDIGEKVFYNNIWQDQVPKINNVIAVTDRHIKVSGFVEKREFHFDTGNDSSGMHIKLFLRDAVEETK